jgi:hypothetical protein
MSIGKKKPISQLGAFEKPRILIVPITHGVWWCTQFFQENASSSTTMRSLMKVGALHLDYQNLWLRHLVQEQTWRVQELM